MFQPKLSEADGLRTNNDGPLAQPAASLWLFRFDAFDSHATGLRRVLFDPCLTAAAPELVVGRLAVIADNDVAIADFRLAEVNLGFVEAAG